MSAGPSEADRDLRGAVRFVALANLGYFGLEFTVALAIASVSLFADSIDFLEDAAVNLLILLALGWSLRARARLGMGLAGLLLVPTVATLWTAAAKLSQPVAPEAVTLSLTGLGALAVNFVCALALARHRHLESSLAKAAFLSARNDVLANAGIVAAGLVTAWTRSILPDLLVGLAIAALNAGAALEVFRAARKEDLAAEP